MTHWHDEPPIVQSAMMWHAGDSAPREGHTMLLCRRRVELQEPADLQLWISASQRFTLYLDGVRTGRGPSLSDPDRWGARKYRWHWEPGTHVIAVCVTHRGPWAIMAQMGGPAFLLVYADNWPEPCRLDDPQTWRSWHHRGWHPVERISGTLPGHRAVDAGEHFLGEQYPWGWTQPGFDDSQWPRMVRITPPLSNPWGNRIGGHRLICDEVPEMLEYPIAQPAIAPTFPIHVSPHTEWSTIVDVGRQTNAYIELSVAGGRGSSIEIVSCEAPRDPVTGRKERRDRPVGLSLPGPLDIFEPGGGPCECFETHWFRSFRYLVLRVRTAAEPAVLQNLALRETRFPLRVSAEVELEGSDEAARSSWDRLWTITRRTAELCAHEILFDCPHYEQAQFAGDSRIQSLYHYVAANDDRLPRKAIADLAAGRAHPGLLRSQFPSRFYQIICTYSLHWIGMLEDFRQWRGDAEFVAPFLPLARDILQWFLAQRRDDGLLRHLRWAPFCDWAFEYGNAPQDPDGGSSMIASLLAQACAWMERLERWCGYPELAARWRRECRALREAVRRLCLGPEGLVRDSVRGSSSSVHAQTEAALAGVFPTAEMARRALIRSLEDPSVRQPATFYYLHHVGMAALSCGCGDLIHRLLNPWFACIREPGLTTLPEKMSDPRSDCHGWSVFSGIAPVTHILGFRPDPRFAGAARLLWRPHLGPLRRAAGSWHLPKGPVRVEIKRMDAHLEVELECPVTILVESQRRELPPGHHRLRLPARDDGPPRATDF